MATVTKPRGPIAANYSSPGPAYALPRLVGAKEHDPRSTKQRGPAYSFGTRHAGYNVDSSPGPCYYPDPKFSNKGPEGSPKYSIYSRPKDGNLDKTPGPGEYDTSKGSHQVYASSPRVTFGNRHDERNTDTTPGPNAYMLPTTLGKTIQSDKKSAPAISIGGRSKQGGFAEDLQKTPGPGAYTTVQSEKYKSAPPKYSLTGRNEMPGDTTLKPGPAAYSPEKQFKNAKNREPAFSFGVRHSQYSGTLITQADVSA